MQKHDFTTGVTSSCFCSVFIEGSTVTLDYLPQCFSIIIIIILFSFIQFFSDEEHS